MTAITDPPIEGFDGPNSAGPTIVETYWGYVIREAQDRFDRETVSEVALRFLCIVFLMAASVQWLLPASFFPGNVFAMKAGLSLVFGAFAVALYGYANRGFSTDIQVDTLRRELRVSDCTSRGQTRLRTVVPMRWIEEVVVRPFEGADASAELLVRMLDRPDFLTIARGPERKITGLSRRLKADLCPVEERLDQRLASSVQFRSQRVV